MSIYNRRGKWIRVVYVFNAFVWYILTLQGRFYRGKTIILCYHGVNSCQKDNFYWQMNKLSLLLTAQNKKWDICKIWRCFNHVSVTFDDAFANLLENALPLLNELHIPAVIFAVPGNMGCSPQWNIAAKHSEYNEIIMTTQQIKSISGDLIKIGSHTQTHPNLSKLSGEDVRWELTESKRNLERLLGKPVEDLALPHGAYNAEVLRIAQEAGYKRIYTLEPKLVRESQEIGPMGRFSMSPDIWPVEFYLTCAGAYSWLFSFRRFVKWVGL
jgi:peptidoglycan/xylan/chitin deacetylase (PgdA/CDA1 family)